MTMAGGAFRSGDITDTGFFGTEGGDGPEALDPAVVALVDELMAGAAPGREGLIRVLLGLQRTFDRVSWRVQELVAERYGMSTAQVAGVVGYYPRLSPEHGHRASTEAAPVGAAPVVRQALEVLARGEIVDPGDIDHAMALGAYGGLRRAVTEHDPASLIDRIKRSGLQERSGSGFPVGLRWALVADTDSVARYVIGSGERGGPGPSADRLLLETDPHAVVEGMIITGFAVGARAGRLFLCSDHVKSIDRIERALTQARSKGLLGRRVMGCDFDFEIEVCENAGASVGGEETSLINVVQGRRAVARPRPPFPAQHGLWGRPTCVSSLETLANIPLIVAGPTSRQGPGPGATKVVGVSGPGIDPFLVEVVLGTTVGQLLDQFVVGEGDAPSAVHVGGPAGATLGRDRFDVALDYGSLRRLGASLGAGGLLVLDGSVCPVKVARSLVAFCAEESCGTCPPCRIGTQVLLELLDAVEAGLAGPEDLHRIERLCRHIAGTSMCELGRTAPNPVLTGLHGLRSVYDAHLDGRGCPARR